MPGARAVAAAGWLAAACALACGCKVTLPPDARFASYQDATADTATGPDTQAEVGCQGNGDCDDGVACTVDTCAAGTCSHAPDVAACDDTNPCTTDTCGTSGCGHAPRIGTCDDGDACTTSDACTGTACAGTGKSCDDGQVCTQDSCVKESGCAWLALDVTCTDGDACTLGETCALGKCVGGKPNPCDDGNKCTVDTCGKPGGCQHATEQVEGLPCSDGDACTVGETCNGQGGCIGGKPTTACNDGNPCTDDGCLPAEGCTVTANAAACSDGNACTSDGCAEGKCKGSKIACIDGNPCTTDDLCDAKAGCIYTVAATGLCDDGDPCTTGDSCALGACDPGKGLLDCDDKNPCTDDSCKPLAGCVAVNNTVACQDGLGCTVGDKCLAGTCTGTVVTGQTIVESAQQDIGHAVVSTAKVIAVAGTMFVVGKNDDFRLLRLEHSGKIIGDKTFGTQFQDTVTDIAAMPDGGFIMAGFHKPSENVDAYLIRINPFGEDTWHLKFGGSGIDEARAVVAVPAGGVAFSGSRTNGGVDFWLVRLDVDGNQQWEASYDSGLAETAEAMAVLPDGFVLVGSTQPTGAGLTTKARLVRTDAAGKLLWQQVYGQAIDKNHFTSVVPAGDGFFVGGSREFGNQAGEMQALVMRLDSTGGVVWEQMMGGDGGDRVLGVVALDDGYIAVGERAPSALAPVDAGLWRFAPDGKLLFEKIYAGPLFESLRAVARTATGVVAAGYRRASTTESNNTWVVRADLSGGLDCSGTGICGKSCDDAKPCTADWCDSVKGCQTSALPEAAPCEDGDFCLVGESCKAGACTGGKPNPCDDGNACTADACVPGTGCSHKAVADGSACLPGATCIASVCKAEAACALGFDTGVLAVEFDGATRLADGGFAAMGTVPQTVAGASQGLRMVRFDATGKQVWGITSQDQGQPAAIAADVVELTGGDLVGVGRIVGAGSGGVQGHVWRVTGKGVDVWMESLGGTGYDALAAVAALGSGGVVAVGETDAKGQGGLDAWLVVLDAAGKTKLDKTFGGIKADAAHDVLALGDGGLVVAASTASQGQGGRDGWLVRTDATGAVLWERLFGGSGDDRLETVVAQPGGGLALLLTTAAPNDATQVVRTDAQGTALWTTQLGDLNGFWRARDLVALPDGGLGVVGGTAKVGTAAEDLWFVRLNLEGHQTMQRKIDGGGLDEGRAIVALPGGGIVFAGVKKGSATGTGLQGWLLRTDDWGHTTCTAAPKCAAKNASACDDLNTCTVDSCDDVIGCKNSGLFAGAACTSGGCSVGDTCSGSKCQAGKPKLWGTKSAAIGIDGGLGLTVAPGGFVVAGYRGDGGRLARMTAAGGVTNDVAVGVLGTVFADAEAVAGGVLAAGSVPGNGGSDGYAIRLTDADQTVWEASFGGAQADSFADVAPVAGGFALVGTTASAGAGGEDVWVVRTGDDGKAIWNKTFGGSGHDQGHAGARVGDGLVVVGWTTAKGAGEQDAWLVSLSATGGVTWDLTYGTEFDDHGYDVVALVDGYAFAGMRGGVNVSSAWLVRVDVAGKVLWEKTFGGSLPAHASGLVAVPDGLAVTGRQEGTTSKGNVLLARTDTVGNVVWNKSYNLTPDDRGHAVIALPDGFAVAGEADGDLWVVRTDVYGNSTCNEALGCIFITGCDDGKACTLDWCVAPKGCTHTALSDGAPCDDGSPCSGADACSAGVCKGGAAVGCL